MRAQGALFVSAQANVSAAKVKARSAGRSHNGVSGQANVSAAKVKARSAGRSHNGVSAQANVSAAKVKARSAGRSHNAALPPGDSWHQTNVPRGRLAALSF